MRYLKGNCEGKPCQSCGEIIQVYSTSGLCRKCFHKRRGEGRRKGPRGALKEWKFYCDTCGTPITDGGKCEACRQGDKDRLLSYRVFRGISEHRYIYQKRVGEIPEGYIIHHLNGLKGDNRIENLLAMDRSLHNGKEHILALQLRIRFLEESLASK
jgi:hypothetical protein